MKTLKAALAALMLAVALPASALNSIRSSFTSLTAQNDALTMEGRNYGSVLFQLTGTWSATITFEGTLDEATWVAVPAINLNSASSATTATANGMYMVTSIAMMKVRARVSSYTSGTVVAIGQSSEGIGKLNGSTAGGGGGGGDASAANQATEIASLDLLDDLVNTHDGAAGTKHVIDGGYASSTAPTDVSANGDAVRAWYLRNGSATINLRNSSGTEVGTASAPVRTDPTGTTAQPITDNGGSVTVDNGGTFPVQAGQVADGAAASGNPVTVGGIAKTSDPTAEADGDGVAWLTTVLKKLVVMPYALPGERWSYAAASGGITNTTGVTVKAAVSGQKNCVTSVDIVNGHASVSTEVVLRDGASGTVLKRWWAQAGGGGVARRLEPPVCGSTNTLLEVAAITTGTATYVNMEGYEGAE